MTRKSISVALCTFEGEAFLRDQLQSLAEQTCKPDELIVFDDGSTDRTMEILQAFSKSASFPMQIHHNEKNLGPAKNFAQAITACQGEIISFCDQDDIWEPSKLSATAEAFARDPQLGFVFSDARICDSNCHPMGYRLWDSIGFTRPQRVQFNGGKAVEVLLRQNVVTGATMSFASRYRPLVLPIPPGWMHDGWIALLLASVGKAQAIPDPLIRYRQHAEQSIGAQRRSLYQQYLNAKWMDRTVFDQQANDYEAALTRLQEQTDFDMPPLVIRNLQEKIQHARRRSAIRLGQSSRVLPAISELLSGRYQKFSLGWKSFAQDLFL